MGVFSWKTSDTKKSIPNRMQSIRPTFEVYMIDNKGRVWYDAEYNGYGIFGGKDFFELVAEMNGVPINEGHSLYYKYDPKTLYPMLVQDPKIEWVNMMPKECEYQGHFY
tara:strand:+ start:897 stop:1223 length:327 start_codon:yes stop_codon:yes gene_type:complete